jgi:ribosomal protein S18 acetylase RimI-like enzyme
MVTFRQMTEADVPAAVTAFESGLLGIAAGFGMPVTGNSIQDERRRQDRTRHFLGTDPGGSWVAEEGDTIVGMSQSFVREGYWMLSQLGTVPGRQGRGVGRDLLKLALSHGDPLSPGTIQCSRDPKAMALYTGFGFTLHPVVTAWGMIRPGTVTRPEDVVRYESDQVGERELAVVDGIDRHVRGSARSIDIVAMLAQPGNRLLLHGDQGYAVAKDERIVTLGARQEESAALV